MKSDASWVIAKPDRAAALDAGKARTRVNGVPRQPGVAQRFKGGCAIDAGLREDRKLDWFVFIEFIVRGCNRHSCGQG